MKKSRNVIKILLCVGTVVLLADVSFLAASENDFILPSWGGGMVHCDPQLTDNIRLPAPVPNATNNVGEVWYRFKFGGEQHGTYGNSIAGNSKIAACVFGNIGDGILSPFTSDNLIIYDYYGNRLWSSGCWFFPNITENPWSLNPSASGSVPMVDVHDRVIACDFQKIIFVNASDRDNVHVE